MPFFLSNSRLYTHNNDYGAIMHGIITILKTYFSFIDARKSIKCKLIQTVILFLNKSLLYPKYYGLRITKTDRYKRVCYIQRIMHCIDRYFEATAKRCKTNSHTVENKVVPSISYMERV